MERVDGIIVPAKTAWRVDPAAQRVSAAMVAAGYRAYFVGGCVRNALLNEPDTDVDLATDAPPQEVIAAAKAAGLKSVPTGIEHGTVTVLADGTPFEVTTFRRDVATDGRRAVVAFSTDMADDARRRDFTMNALYADADGAIYDPLGGLPDLMARRVRFIEDPDARIREDYLRILRFFRFSAWYADPAKGFDHETLAAIARNLDGIEQLSGERLGQEMTKLLCAPDPSQSLATMQQTGVLARVLPGSDDRLIGPVVHGAAALALAPDWALRLAALGGEDVGHRLRLSKADAQMLALITANGFAGPPLSEIAYRYGMRVGRAALVLRAALANALPDPAQLDRIARASDAQFPIKAADLMPALSGPALGAKLKALEAAWIASDFALTRAALLGEI